MEIIETTYEHEPQTHIELQTRRYRGRVWITLDTYDEDRVDIALIDSALTFGPARVVRVYDDSGAEQVLEQHG